MAKSRLLLILLASVVGWAPIPAEADSEAERVIHVTAESFAFTPEVIRVSQGERMTLAFPDSIAEP
jgi:plastocyanin